ncbi:hypothetical protein [Endozoicomonas elysicola]|uniref:hypothetical protein n=1 Tax=Endozoicomonas elysicola TaxID=305900 RepID=UPI0012693727|nr:hypothetical protein [Endozoicomonas elysicola]
MSSAIDSEPHSPCHGLAESGLPEPIDEQECILPQELETMLFSASDTLPDLVKVETEQGTIPKPLTDTPPTETYLGKQLTRALDEEVFQNGESATGFSENKGLEKPLLSSKDTLDSGFYETHSLPTLCRDTLSDPESDAESWQDAMDFLSEPLPSLPEVEEGGAMLQQGLQMSESDIFMDCLPWETFPVAGNGERPVDSQATVIPEPVEVSETPPAEISASVRISSVNATPSPGIVRALANGAYQRVKNSVGWTLGHAASIAGWGWKKLWGDASGQGVERTSTAGESALEHGQEHQQERAPIMVSSSRGSAPLEVDLPDPSIVRGGTVEEDSAESQE